MDFVTNDGIKINSTTVVGVDEDGNPINESTKTPGEDGKIDVINISRYKAEIEAQNYLLSVKKLYNTPEEEILETKANLQYRKEKLENERKKNYL